MAKYRQKSCQICEEPNCDGNIQHNFMDGHRQVDFVLVYPKNNLNEKHRQKREMFCQNLELEGLELEYDSSHATQQFIKIHVPQNVLIRYCEILKFRMPIREKYLSEVNRKPKYEQGLWNKITDFVSSPFKCVELQSQLKPGTEFKVYHEFERNKEFLFDMYNRNFFSQSVRISISSYILERTRFTGILDVSNLSRNVVGIEKLLQDKVFRGAFPLHDGDLSEQKSKRYLLLEEWASVKHWMRHQPLDEIKEYFGAQIALYFAWIGYYSQMLIVPSIFGIICVLYGLSTIFSNQISREICSANNTIIVCPECDEQCDYWHLNETCLYSRLKNTFDNQMTVIFAIFMSIWATIYLEMWKRYSTRLVHNWGLSNYARRKEHPRPQYLSKLKNTKQVEVNVDTLMKEPKLSYWSARFPRYVLSYTTIILLIALSFIAIGSIIVFRMATIKAQHFYDKKHSMTYQTLLLPITTAIIDLVIITMLNYAYKYLAVILTNLELKRTQIEYDESVSIKIYLFQFVNYYSSMFYISFIKGKLVGYPAKYNRIFGLRQEECNPGGCLTELCIELAVFMIGKQIINAVMENFVPFARKTYNKILVASQKSNKRFSVQTPTLTHTQWEEDNSLLKWESQFIYKEYLELVIQFGFVMLFIVAFPLAPLLALLNNVLEMRLDAKKYLLHFRRPVPRRVKDIGHWNNILQMICRMSVITNAILIAFSSDFIPQIVYQSFYRNSGSYLNFTYSEFDVKNFQEGAAPLTTKFSNLQTCYYESFRNGPNTLPKYKKSLIYWQILAVRVIFVVLYQNLVSSVRLIIDWLIPKVPDDVKKDEKWGENLIGTIIMNQGLEMIDLGNNN
uniref:Anoctamin n=1 Tax=Culicoides sonorensis TaxID=179676 RepID=A0A336M8Y6_CULSO